MVWLGAAVQENSPTRYACFCEANLLSHAVRNPDLRMILDDADCVFADGVASVKLAAIHGNPLPERIPGPTFFLRACEAGIEKGWRHFLYGGAPGVADRLAEKLRSDYPGIQIVGTHSPPFREMGNLAEGEDVLRRIEEVGTDILWVGLGGPKQEFWMAEHRERIHVPVMLGVGAAFDFHSKTRPWAPAWIRRLGVEWLFRMFTGGRSTLVRNARCCSVVALVLMREFWHTRLSGRKEHTPGRCSRRDDLEN